MATRIAVRNTRLEDIPAAVKVEQAAWAPPWPQDYVFTAEHLRSQIEMFPEGQFCAEVNGQFAGFVTTMLTNYDVARPEPVTWAKMCDNGYITNHNRNGSTIFGVNASVHPDFSRTGASDMLLDRVGVMCLEKGLRQIILGSRIPSYHRYADQMTAEEYIAAKRKSGKPLDPELYLYTSHALKVVTLVPEYIPDPESLNYGVLVTWINPLWKVRWIPGLGKIAAAIMLRKGFR